MNPQYIYPANLKETAKLWFWSLKDLMIGGAALLVSIVSLTQVGFVLPLAGTLVYAFLTIKIEDASILDFIKRAANYFIFTQQLFIWKLKMANRLQITNNKLLGRSRHEKK